MKKAQCLLFSSMLCSFIFFAFSKCKKGNNDNTLIYTFSSKDWENCSSCENETIESTIENVPAIVILWRIHPEDNTVRILLSSSKHNIENYKGNFNNIRTQDSVWVPCPDQLPSALLKDGDMVYISGNISSCDGFYTLPNVDIFPLLSFGKKIQLTSISKK